MIYLCERCPQQLTRKNELISFKLIVNMLGKKQHFPLLKSFFSKSKNMVHGNQAAGFSFIPFKVCDPYMESDSHFAGRVGQKS